MCMYVCVYVRACIYGGEGDVYVHKTMYWGGKEWELPYAHIQQCMYCLELMAIGSHIDHTPYMVAPYMVYGLHPSDP